LALLGFSKIVKEIMLVKFLRFMVSVMQRIWQTSLTWIAFLFWMITLFRLLVEFISPYLCCKVKVLGIIGLK
jgi:hypothetical protein